MKLLIMCDGGCENNQSPTERWAYGSFVIFSNNDAGINVELSRGNKLSFGVLTNNEAEYLALINALSQIGNLILHEPLSEIRIQMDSQLVINQVCQKWDVNAPNLIPYVRYARQVLDSLKAMKASIVFNYVPREKIVEVLGH